MLSASLFTSIFFVFFFSPALAEIFVTSPLAGATCQAGQSCTVQWVDDGVEPTLSTIGACTVGLYHGDQELVQQLEPVNAASAQSFTFTPQANAGPNSDSYYVAFVSSNAKLEGNSPYVGFTPNFALSGMTGSFDAPVASLTSGIPVPASVSTPPDASIPVSTFSGTISISVSSATAPSTTQPTSSSPKPSGLTTSRVPSSSPVVSSPLPSTSASGSASAAVGLPHPGRSAPALALVLAAFILLCF